MAEKKILDDDELKKFQTWVRKLPEEIFEKSTISELESLYKSGYDPSEEPSVGEWLNFYLEETKRVSKLIVTDYSNLAIETFWDWKYRLGATLVSKFG